MHKSNLGKADDMASVTVQIAQRSLSSRVSRSAVIAEAGTLINITCELPDKALQEFECQLENFVRRSYAHNGLRVSGLQVSCPAALRSEEIVNIADILKLWVTNWIAAYQSTASW